MNSMLIIYLIGAIIALTIVLMALPTIISKNKRQ